MNSVLIGYSMLVMLYAAVTALIAYEYGTQVALFIWVGTIAILAWVCVAAALIGA